MEVKVGQVWKSKYGSCYRILDIKDKTFVVEIDGDGVTVIFKKYLTDAKLVSESDPSDLEIVHKALEKAEGTLTMYADGSSCISFFDNEDFVSDTEQELLTWAKQQIGV